MKKIEIRSEYPCLIKWKGGEEFLDEATSLFFSTPELLFVYPATGKRDDIAFVLDLSQPDKNFCQIFNLEENTLCLLTKSISSIKIKEEVLVNGKSVNLILSNSNAEFNTDERIAYVTTLPPKTYELTSYENFVILKIKSLSAEQIVLFNTVTNELFSEEGNIVEFDRGEISCQRYGKEEKYSIVENEIIRAKTYEPPPKNAKVLPLKFLEKIKNHDFKSAISFLQDSMSASEEKLSAYFGEIKKILPLSLNRFLIVKKSGYYEVEIQTSGEKISNIEIID